MFRTTMSILAVLTISCSAASAAEGEESVAFRAKEWQSLHSRNDADAEKTIAMLKKLGCETRLDEHGDHADISFRCIEWRAVTLETHENADRWEQWLSKNGFQTLHGHSHAPSADAIVIQYRQNEWLSQHFDNDRQAEGFMAICKGLGCEVRKEDHSGHIDVMFRCGSARNLVCIDHDEAHSLQAWLEKKGFQTEHAH